MDKYKELFVSESGEILAKFSKLLVELEKSPENSETINEIFRQAHTLKGMSASMGYANIVKLSHAMESVLDLLRGRRLSLNKNMMVILFESLDLLEELTVRVSAGGQSLEAQEEEERKIAGLAKRLDELTYGKEIVREEESREKRMLRLEESDRILIHESAKEGVLAYRVTITLRSDCGMPGVRAFMVIKNLREMGRVLQEELIENQVKSAKFGRYFGFFFLTKGNPEAVKEKIKEISEVEDVQLSILELDEVILEKKGEKALDEHFRKAVEPHRPALESQMVRVAVERLDSLMNLAGELIIIKNRLLDVSSVLGNEHLDEALARMSRISSNFQNEMISARLVPLGYIFDRFPRLVRDTANEENKQVSLEMEGSEIGLDRTILDEINDPLIHILRNAVSHGIEIPEIRVSKNKPATGKIKLLARKERSFIIIEVSDDGAGIDVEEIKRVSREKGIISEEDLLKLSEQDVMMLITTAGFSTSKKVTEISGRGVGMNTVKNKIESFGGSLLIDAKVNEGTKFTLRLPVSVAILQALLVEVAGETYAIPFSSIIETTYIDVALIKTMEHHDVILYRDEVLPLVNLRERLGFEKCRENKKELTVVVIEAGFRKAGFIVDELIGRQEIVVKTLSEDLRGVKGAAGATILGSGRVALIMDAASII